MMRIETPFADYVFYSNMRSSSSWRELKDQGREQYEQGHYEEALSLYVQSNSRCTTPLDRQVILSNMVACRLKLHQNERALIDAKECVRLNPSWSKAHVRLASAYIAMGASNDACNALQTAIRHDPSNAMARHMLLQQLQRDRQQQSNPDMDTTSTVRDEVPPPPGSTRPDDIPSARRSYHEDEMDDELSWVDWMHAMWGRCKSWYLSQSESRQTGLKVLVGMIVLYISFGGRFGWGSSLSSSYNDPYQTTAGRDQHSEYDSPTSRQQQHHRSSQYYDQSRYHPYDGSARRHNNMEYRDTSYRDNSYRSSSWGGGYYQGGSYGYAGDTPPWQWILVMAVLAYVARLNGMNPLPIVMMLMQGGGRMMYRRPGMGQYRRRRGRMGW